MTAVLDETIRSLWSGAFGTSVDVLFRFFRRARRFGAVFRVAALCRYIRGGRSVSGKCVNVSGRAAEERKRSSAPKILLEKTLEKAGRLWYDNKVADPVVGCFRRLGKRGCHRRDHDHSI